MISSKLDFRGFNELTIVVTGRSGRSVTLTVILYLLHVSVGVIPVGDMVAWYSAADLSRTVGDGCCDCAVALISAFCNNDGLAILAFVDFAGD